MMRTDVLEFEHFYQSPLGHLICQSVQAYLTRIWGQGAGLRLAGFGYCDPYLELFESAQMRLSITPASMGISVDATQSPTCRVMAADTWWPLPDACLDRVFVIHGLEETPLAQSLFREIWRVLTDDGKVIVIVTNRRSPWAMMERTPLAAGRPYLRGQLQGLLHRSLFTPVSWENAIFMPPFNNQFAQRAAPLFEAIGSVAWPALAAMTLVEAEKVLALPIKGHRTPARRVRVLRA